MHAPTTPTSPPPQTRPWFHPLAPVDRGLEIYHQFERRFYAHPLGRLSLAGPRTLRYVANEAIGRRHPDIPGARITPGLISQVVMDESIMAVVVGPNRFPRRADYLRVSDELARARSLFIKRGWIENPASFHRDPPPLLAPSLSRGWALGQGYDRLTWPSEFEPNLGVPGTDRWLAFEANQTASAWVLRHPGGPRPWVVCVHGFGTGTTFMDLFSFRARRLHYELGVNIAAVVLPVHGPRRPSRLSGEEFLGFDMMNAVHGLTQAIWDVRRLLSWVRQQDPQGVALFGVSLGAMVSALVASFEAELDLVLAGIPVVDFCDLIVHHAPHNLQLRSVEHEILDGTAQQVHRVVSPLALPPKTPHHALAIFAGLGDRLATTDQARRLYEHWDRPQTCWFAGNHVGYLWSDSVWKFVHAAMQTRGLVASSTPGPTKVTRRRLSR